MLPQELISMLSAFGRIIFPPNDVCHIKLTNQTLKIMGYQAFDQYASEYDAWFMENTNVLETELRLVASCLKDSGKILSIGCGSALFEKLLADRYDIRIEHGIEPAEGMAAIARKRGFDVEINTAEEADYGENLYDTVLFNGCPCYMQDLGLALKKHTAHCAKAEKLSSSTFLRRVPTA